MTPLFADSMTKRSIDSEAMVPYWDQTDTLIDGIKAMRKAGDQYLPKFNDEPQAEYEFRLKMTKMTNVYRDIVEGLASKPFEQSVTLPIDQADNTAGNVPEAIRTFTYDVDGSGNNLTVFAAQTFFNGINSAIDWILVDMDPVDPSVRTVADAQRAGRRPYWSHVLGRNILDVRSQMIAGREVLTYVKIFEPGAPDHVRVFERTPDGSVTWTLYKRGDRATEADPTTTFFRVGGGRVTLGVIPMVPFSTGRRDGRSWKLFPAMLDAADLQVELYQQESGLKFIKTLGGYPMLAANGMTAPKDAKGDPQKVAIGPTKVLWGQTNSTTGQTGSWAWVQPDAMLLKYLSDDVIATIQNLRELGRQPLTASSSNITVITAAVAAGKAKSAVKAWAYKLKDALENALALTALWLGVQYDPTVHVFVDFDDWMEGEDLDALATMRKNGDISLETLWEEMGRRGVLSTNFTPERERARLLADVPSGNTAADTIED